MNILVTGWFGHGNTGDEAYKSVFPLLLPDHKLVMKDTFNPDIDKPDAIIVGGGDILYPHFTKPLRDVPEIPKVLASVTMTNGSDLKSLKLFNKIYVRDLRSQQLGSQYAEVKYMPDFTFLLHPDKVAGKKIIADQFAAYGHQLRKKVVTVVFNAYVMSTTPSSLRRDFTNFQRLSQDIADAVDVMDTSVLFLPFSAKPPWDDRVANGWVSSFSRKYYKNVSVYDRLSVQDTLNVVAASDVVVSTRLHSSIFSTIGGVPFIDLTHHDKNKGFIETLGKQEWSMGLWEISINQFKKLLGDHLNLSLPHPDLVKFTDHAREQLKNVSLL
jgi:polysaccharide pyruvyl transferase WcaK-like protein